MCVIVQHLMAGIGDVAMRMRLPWSRFTMPSAESYNLLEVGIATPRRRSNARGVSSITLVTVAVPALAVMAIVLLLSQRTNLASCCRRSFFLAGCTGLSLAWFWR
jgi:hypothetical protein